MNRPWIVTLVCGATLISLALGMRQGFGLFLPPIAAEFEIGRGTVALAIALQNLAWGLFSPFFGGFADKYSPRLAVAAGGLLYAAGLAVMGTADGGGDILLGQLIVGMGLGGVGFSVVLGVVGRAAPTEKRSLAFGVVTAGGSFGQFAVVPVQESLLSAFGWSEALIILAAASTVMVVFALGLKNGEDGNSRHTDDQTMGDALSEAVSHRGFVLLTTGFFVCGFQVVFIATHLPAFLQDKGVDPQWAAWSLALVGLFNIAGSLAAGWTGDRFSKRTSLAWFYLTRAVIIATFVLLPISAGSALVFGALIGLFWLGTVPLTSGLVATFFGTRYMSMLYGIVFFSHQIGSFFGAWAGGYIYDRFGSYDLMWWLTVASGVVAFVLHMMINERPAPRLAPA